MRAILIDPRSRTVEEVTFSGDYKAIQNTLKYEGDDHFVFTALGLDAEDHDTMYLDDEGLLKVGIPKFIYGDYPSQLAGRALILGVDDEGDSISCKISLDEVRTQVKWSDEVTDGNPGPSQIIAW